MHAARRLTALMAMAALATAWQPTLGAEASPPETRIPLYRDTGHPFAERAADLVSRMTLAEKVSQLRTNSAPAIPRLGVQQYTYWSEGQHGVNLLGGNTNAGSVTGGAHATSFPTNQAASMSWDPDLIYQETTAISDEARGFLDKSLWGVGQNNLGPDKNAYGMLTYWAPTVNMDRDPRWGRTDEGFGEDPYLVSRMAGAFVNGYQGQSPTGQATSPYLKVAATAKHYALNDVERTRHSGSSDTTEANIRDYYTPQFASLISDANVAGLMTSYNAVNGTPVPANTYLTNLLAQRTYGFNGYTTSDCSAVGDVYQSTSHNWAPPGWTSTPTGGGQTVWTNTATGLKVSGAAGAQAYALRAGTQLNCTGTEYTLDNIQEAIRAGILTEGIIDNALVHVFTTRMRTGEFDPAERVPYTRIGKDVIENRAHQDLAVRVADNALVLLKNEPLATTRQALLPAEAGRLGSVVIVGDLAGKVTLGGYSGDPSNTTTAVQGITAAVQAANPAATVIADSCATSTTTTTAASCAAATMAAAATADLVVVTAGTDLAVAQEESDRSGLALPGNYRSLIEQMTAVGNQRMVLALQANGPVAIGDLARSFPAIVYSGYNGQGQGTALADVLFGKQNPSGHLNFTWYTDDSQLPEMANYGLTPAQTGGLGRTYQYFTGTPSYPFGYGMSYTSFGYRDLCVDRDRVTGDDTARISFTVTNTGRVPGATVAQLYATTPAVAGTGQEAAAKRLAGFGKTRVLKPGESQRITLPVAMADLSVWNDAARRQEVARGRYQFMVGPDSSTAALRGAVQVTADARVRLTTVTVQPPQVTFKPGDRLDLTGDNPWIADDTAQAASHLRATRIVEGSNSDQSFADLSHARKTYRSSNPKVASVGPDGKVTMGANGVATLSVTVDGVTGSTTVTVKEPFTFDSPSIAAPGTAFTATATLPHPAGAPALRNATVTLSAPANWTVRAATPTTFATVDPGQTVTVKWEITPPAGADPGVSKLAAQLTFTDPNGSSGAQGGATVALPYPSFTAAYNNVAITNDGSNDGDIDGNKASYPAAALAAADPALVPGASVVHDGLTYTWPQAAPGTPDNVAAVGQVIPLSGTGARLGLLGTGVYGTAAGTAVIIYTDGTQQPFALSFADWWANAATAGGSVLTSVPYININGGRQNQKVSIYATSVPLQQGKTVAYLQLPNVNDGVLPGTVMHVFATAIG